MRCHTTLSCQAQSQNVRKCSPPPPLPLPAARPKTRGVRAAPQSPAPRQARALVGGRELLPLAEEVLGAGPIPHWASVSRLNPWRVSSPFCSRERGDKSASRPTPPPLGLCPLRSNLVTWLAARSRGWSQLHRTGVISERYILPPPQCQPGASSPTECCPRSPGRAAGLQGCRRAPGSLQVCDQPPHRSIDPIFQKGKQRRGEQRLPQTVSSSGRPVIPVPPSAEGPKSGGGAEW